jgi:hypothetical protein
LILDPVAAFLALDPLLGLDATASLDATIKIYKGM